MKHKDLQEAVKDLNTVLNLNMKHIGVAGQALKDSIINTIAPLVETGDTKINELADDTIQVYNQLCDELTPTDPGESTVVPEPGTEEMAEEIPAAEEATEPEAESAEEGDCFGVSYDPENPADCCNEEQCGRFAECVAIVTGKTKKKKPGRKAKEKPPKEVKEKVPSARGIMLDTICQNPLATKEEIRAAVEAAGFQEGTHFKKVTLDTVFSDAHQIFKRLRSAGLMA